MTPEETTPVEAPFQLPEDFVFDMDDVLSKLTFGDIEDIEEATELSFEKIQTQSKGMRGLVWAVLRKDHPSLTYAQTRDLPITLVLAPPEKVEAPLDAEGKD